MGQVAVKDIFEECSIPPNQGCHGLAVSLTDLFGTGQVIRNYDLNIDKCFMTNLSYNDNV